MLSRTLARFILASCAVMTLSLWTSAASAKVKIVIQRDGVVVYSGPGKKYRPLGVLNSKTEVLAASKKMQGKDGNIYYRVLVRVAGRKGAIGYIPVTDAVTQETDAAPADDDLEKYGDIALWNTAIQGSYSMFHDAMSMITVGYMNYLSPGFYFKPFVGTFRAPGASALTAGGEIGNDALLVGPFSGHVSYAAGLFMPSSANTIFAASSKLNAMMQAAFGVRYNWRGSASLSAGLTQAVFFNQNNSLVVNGVVITGEVGL